MMTVPTFDHDGIKLYHGDVFEILDELPLDECMVLCTDPPYAANKYLRVTEASRQFCFETDTTWMGNVSHWVAEWFFQVRMKMHPEGVGWVFCNVHYLGFYLRWAKYAHWPLRGIFALPPDEFLLSFGAVSLSPGEGGLVQEYCKLNEYGQNKNLRMLDALLSVSPNGLVFDPFVGQGNTLIAARDAHRPAVGVEVKDDTVAQAREALARGRQREEVVNRR